MTPPTCVDELVTDAGTERDGPVVDCMLSSECPAAQPVCDPADHVCRGCVADVECPSDVCHELVGACVDEAVALYITPTGAGNACSRAQPCGSLNTALAAATATRRTIRVADGTYPTNTKVRPDGNGAAFVISGTDLAAAGAILSPTMGSLETEGSGTVVIEGVTIASSGNAGFVNRSNATLAHVHIMATSGHGIDNRDRLKVRDSRIEGATGIGIFSNDTLDVQRTEVLVNAGGGISATGGFSIINTVIARNGSASAAFGGVKLSPVAGKPAAFELNTVIRNVSSGLAAAGVTCDQPTPIASSILADNSAFLLGELGTMCTATYSLFGASAAAGTGNLTGNAMFVNDPSDLHLKAGSPAIDKADPASTEAVDLDGRPRPVGAARDIGAYERP